MKSICTKLVVLLVVPISCVFGQTPTPSDDFVCPDKVDRVFPDPNDCSKYFVCTNGLAWHESCAPPLLFDASMLVCNWPDEVICYVTGGTPPVTTTRTTAPPSTTTASPGTTPTGPPVSTTPPPTGQPPSTPSSEFECPDNEYATYPHLTDCTKFYVCFDGHSTVDQCPEGLWYDHTIGVCNWPELVTCSVSSTVTAAPPTTTQAPVTTTQAPGTTPTGPPDPTTERPSEGPSTTGAPQTTSSSEFECPDNEYATYPHPTDCTKFYVCFDGHSTVDQCPEGLWYDHTIGVCNWPEEVDCSAAPFKKNPKQGRRLPIGSLRLRK